MSECDRKDLSRLLEQIDIRILAELLKNRVKLKGALGAMLIDEGLIDPNSPSIDCKDEQAKAILNAIWEADSDIFTQLLREMFAIDKEGDVDTELVSALEKATAEREERVKARDSEAGIKVTESDLKQHVDLDSLELAEDEEENADK